MADVDTTRTFLLTNASAWYNDSATHTSFDTTTGIRQLSADGQSDEAYSISVMRVAKSSRGMVLRRMGKKWVKVMPNAK